MTVKTNATELLASNHGAVQGKRILAIHLAVELSIHQNDLAKLRDVDKLVLQLRSAAVENRLHGTVAGVHDFVPHGLDFSVADRCVEGETTRHDTTATALFYHLVTAL